MNRQLHHIALSAVALLMTFVSSAWAAPGVVITPEQLTEDNLVAIDRTTAVFKFTVEATDLPAAAPIYLTGGDAAFSLNSTVIPAGTSTTEIIVSVMPASMGTHKGGITFDFDAINPELNQSYTFSVKAYDPDHLPVLTLSQTEVTLEAKVGERTEATVKLKPDHCFDYINVKSGEAVGTGIIIGSTLYLPNVAEQNVRLTFQPKTAGTVTQTFTFTTTLGSPVVLTVTGKATGEEEPEEKEGDEFRLDASAPLTTYAQDFETVGRNKPLSLNGWTNVAEKGTRAWWGYVTEGDDAFMAAKATLYDSKVAEADGTDASMLLVSPALDYKNAKNRVLDFRLMGQFLHEGQAETLDICLIEMMDGQPAEYPMSGFDIPAKEDESGTWIPYTVDMSLIPDMPDVFFIGFRLSAKRSSGSTATYYIDDFRWGLSEGSGITTAVTADTTDTAVYSLQGVRVAGNASQETLGRLAPGIYVSGGKKFVLR